MANIKKKSQELKISKMEFAVSTGLNDTLA